MKSRPYILRPSPRSRGLPTGFSAELVADQIERRLMATIPQWERETLQSMLSRLEGRA